jgi:hypothetical protein
MDKRAKRQGIRSFEMLVKSPKIFYLKKVKKKDITVLKVAAAVSSLS